MSGGNASPASASPNTPAQLFIRFRLSFHNPWMLAIYVIAMIATCWHFAYGIWLFSVKWGITPGDRARKRMGYATAAIGTALCIMGLWGMYAFISPQYRNAPADVMPEQPAGVVLPAPATVPSNTTSPTQPGAIR